MLSSLSSTSPSSTSPVRPAAAGAARCSSIVCFDDDDYPIDYLVLYGDAGVLLAYGSVQAIFDVSLAPLYDALAPDGGGAVAVVPHAPLQGMFIAALWTAILLLLKAYKPSITRSLPAAAALRPLVVAWLGSSLGLIALLVALHVSLDAEVDFLLGSLSVIVGWRFLYSQGMPLP